MGDCKVSLLGTEPRSGTEQTTERPRPPIRFERRSLHRAQRAPRLYPHETSYRLVDGGLDFSRLARKLKDGDVRERCCLTIRSMLIETLSRLNLFVSLTVAACFLVTLRWFRLGDIRDSQSRSFRWLQVVASGPASGPEAGLEAQ
jgi:hypothetical protein